MTASALVARTFLAGVLAAAFVADGAEFRSKPSDPGEYPPLPACRLEYSFGWSDLVEAARATVDYRPGVEDLRVTARGATTGVARLLWKMDARHDAIIDPRSFRPRWIEQYEVYRNRNIETRVVFNGPDGLQRFRRVNPDPRLTARWKTVLIDDIFDILGGLLFVRSQALKNGDKLRVVGFPGDSPYLVDLKVMGRDTIPIMGVPRSAIRIELWVQKIEVKKKRPVGLVPYRRFRSGTVWISDDELRVPLRAEVGIFVGSVTGELVGAVFRQ